MKKILLIDNNIDPPVKPHVSLGFTFRRYFELADQVITVRRGPEDDLPTKASDFDGILLTGSKTSCLDKSPWVEHLCGFLLGAIEDSVPTFGVCFGHQMLARAVGGVSIVRKSATPEVGWTEVEVLGSSPIFNGIPKKLTIYSSHFEEVAELPQGFKLLARSPHCAIQAFEISGKPIFGVQFHPEIDFPEAEQRLITAKKNPKVKSDWIFELKRANGFSSDEQNKNARTFFNNFLKLC